MTPDEYLLGIRKVVDALKARSALPEFSLSSEEHDRVRFYFLLRAVDIGEASFRVGSLPLPQMILARILCEDFLMFFWCNQSKANSAQYAKLVRSETIKAMRAVITAGRGVIRSKTTGKDHSGEVLDALKKHIVPSLKVEQVAKDCGLAKVYDMVYRFGSLPIHAKTFDMSIVEDDVIAPFSVIHSMLRVTLDVAERPTTSPDDVLRRLAIDKIGGK